jgi:hypothetical protein
MIRRKINNSETGQVRERSGPGCPTSGFSDAASTKPRERNPNTLNPVLALLLTTVLTTAAAAQVLQQPGTFPGQHGQFKQHGMPQARQTTPTAGMNPAPPPPPSPTTPQPLTAPSLLDQPPQPAKVDIADGKLTVQADNSSLTAILNQVSTSAGMTVDGLNKDERIFGTYGPGEPREIISQLLDGSGYNVVMFGRTTAGTPSQVSLSPRGAALPQGAASRPVKQEDEEEEPQPTQYQDNPPPPPNPNPAPGPGAPSPNGGPRTPQQMLQELQQIRQQQQQQPQNPQDQP